jgi:hypothetical protein
MTCDLDTKKFTETTGTVRYGMIQIISRWDVGSISV